MGSHRTIALAIEFPGAENTAMTRVMAVFPWQCLSLGSTRTVLLSGRTSTERFRLITAGGREEDRGVC